MNEASKRKRPNRLQRLRRTVMAGLTVIAPLWITGVVLKVMAKASDEGRLFGSVGVAEVTEALASQVGLVVDRRQVVGETAKDIGSHEFIIELHAEVSVPVTVEVQAEA